MLLSNLFFDACKELPLALVQKNDGRVRGHAEGGGGTRDILQQVQLFVMDGHL